MLQYMWTLASRRRDREAGQPLVEYGLIIALVSVAAIVGLGALGGALDGMFSGIADTVTNALP